MAAGSALTEDASGRPLAGGFPATVQTIATAIAHRDPFTSAHQRRVAALAGVIARRLSFDGDAVAGIVVGAAIHDLGKILVPSEILNKPGRLSPFEFDVMRNHARVGSELVQDIEFPWPVAEMIGQHHERLDGTGYPCGLRGDQILPETRVISVADVVEAMWSHRPYRASLGLTAALGEIQQHRGTWFDPDVVDACLSLFANHEFSFDDGGA